MAEVPQSESGFFETKAAGYYGGDRTLLVELLAAHHPLSGRVLDVGCGEGALGAELLGAGFAEVIGIEPVPEAAEWARTCLSRVVDGTFESVDREALGAFDVIVFADSLEHFVDPWSALAQAREMLRPDGVLVLSVPNVSHWSVLWPALGLGQWDYADEGLLDRGHLRFFTPNTLLAAVIAAGYLPVGTANTEIALPKGRGWIRPVLKRFFPHTLAYQYHVVAVPTERNVTNP